MWPPGMGRYDTISPSEIFEARGLSVEDSRYRAEAHHHGICNRSNKDVTEQKTDGTCVEWQRTMIGTTLESAKNMSCTSVLEGCGGAEK